LFSDINMVRATGRGLFNKSESQGLYMVLHENCSPYFELKDKILHQLPTAQIWETNGHILRLLVIRLQ